MNYILDAKNVEANGLLSKIQIGGKIYELKDLIARQQVIELWAESNGLRERVGDVEGEFGTGASLVNIIKNIQESAYDDTAIRALITALDAEVAKKADATQVAKDIEAAVKAEADIARAAEKANADEIARVDAALKLAVENNEEGIDSIKELASWIEAHGPEAKAMSEAITANTNAIAAMDEAYKAADAGLSGRIETLEGKFTGDESVDALIEAAKQAAIAAAAKDASDKDAVVTKAYQDADKAITDSLKALAHKDSASGTVAGQTISGVKATGTTTGSITVELAQSEHAMNSTGKYTPAGNVAGTVLTAGSIAVTAKHEDVAAALTKGDYTPAGEVSVALSGNSFNAITGVGTQASFVEGAFTPAALDASEVSATYVEEALVGSVEDECLTFTAAATKALSASKVNSFSGGTKAADQFTTNSLPTMAAQTVGVQSASFTGTKAEDLVVTGVSYKKADIDTATFTGATVDIAASFTGTEGDIAVAGLCHDYTVKTAQFNGDAIELAVGDISVSAKEVTVQ
jgi:hypothetical protein